MVKMLNQALGHRHECQYTQNLYGYLTGDSRAFTKDITMKELKNESDD